MAVDAAERAQHPSGRGAASAPCFSCSVVCLVLPCVTVHVDLPFPSFTSCFTHSQRGPKIERTRSRETRILFLAGYPQGVVQVRRILVGRHIMSTSDQCQGQRGVFLPAEAWKRPCR